jgi:alkylation response protein AidB-like acyl-CoA dehydrogenase
VTAASLADRLDRGAELLAEIATGATARERDRALPHAEIRRLAGAGLLALRVPVDRGGPGATTRELFEFVMDLAAADSNIAQALRSSYAFVESVVTGGDAEEQARWLPRILDGDVFGNAGWERGDRNGAVNTRIRDDGAGGFVVDGTKFYSTGALFADWVSTSARADDDRVVGFTVPSDRAGLIREDDWDGIGQRLTASGTTRLEAVRVAADELRSSRSADRSRRSPMTPFLQLYLAAVEAGIARRAVEDATSFARNHARPIVHSGVERSVDDPYVARVVGEMSAQAFAARAAIGLAAERLDAVRAVSWRGDDQEALAAVALDVARAQYVAVGAALRCGELVFDVGSGSATLARYGLDRHWRNARTVANHNPRDHKIAVIGTFHLTGTPPPTSGLF